LVGDHLADLVVVGGGLAGCEAAWQASRQGLSVDLYEMRPQVMTGAHTGARLAELVCSNSLGSNQLDRASGLLKQELRELGSLLIACADGAVLPAGGALAVDRERFAQSVTAAIEGHPLIRVVRQEMTAIPDGLVIVASGPLTSDSLASAIQRFTGVKGLYFYDAVAPILTADSIDMSLAFRGSRYGQGDLQEGDYINCPMTRDEYLAFVEDLGSAECVKLKEFEHQVENGVTAGAGEYFEGCLPIEVQARRGPEALEYGPLRPVGLIDPHTRCHPHAVVQLRQEDLAGTLYNMVGFQTNLLQPEQERIFRRIPGLQIAEFVRYGQMHRNTYILSPLLLKPTLQTIRRPELFFAGQITGVEGYAGNIATGLLAGINAARIFFSKVPMALPLTTMAGALCHYITHALPEQFQPMKANLGIVPQLEGQGRRKLSKHEKGMVLAHRSLVDLRGYLAALELG
jgi:methylenetetrahydrofolate--tRNA-(uracil-5-)-methyltransferase